MYMEIVDGSPYANPRMHMGIDQSLYAYREALNNPYVHMGIGQSLPNCMHKWDPFPHGTSKFGCPWDPLTHTTGIPVSVHRYCRWGLLKIPMGICYS